MKLKIVISSEMYVKRNIFHMTKIFNNHITLRYPTEDKIFGIYNQVLIMQFDIIIKAFKMKARHYSSLIISINFNLPNM